MKSSELEIDYVSTYPDWENFYPNKYDYTVLFNGSDITDRCFMADVKSNRVGLFIKEDGEYVLDETKQEAKKEYLSGKVEIVVNYKQ